MSLAAAGRTLAGVVSLAGNWTVAAVAEKKNFQISAIVCLQIGFHHRVVELEAPGWRKNHPVESCFDSGSCSALVHQAPHHLGPASGQKKAQVAASSRACFSTPEGVRPELCMTL
mmetsp:Transcript_52151/g.124257  ORF Transcript_52151/g.124257 Transcript_52151/m.124257 type:complete len:115 (-) Transcript_52151:48-392(-)